MSISSCRFYGCCLFFAVVVAQNIHARTLNDGENVCIVCLTQTFHIISVEYTHNKQKSRKFHEPNFKFYMSIVFL